MIKNYLLHALRNISRNKLISFINIFGLSVAFTLTIHLVSYVKNELSYDKFHAKHDRIYRILTKSTEPGQEPFVSAICQGRFPEIIAGIPEVERCVRVYNLQKAADIEVNNSRLTNNRIIYADSSFFDVFSFKLLSGDPGEVLKDPNSIILSRSLAIKAFNSTDVIGRVIRVNDVTGRVIRANNRDYTIGGILEDVPANSHLQFDILCGFHEPSLHDLVKNSGNEFFTYVLLRQNVDADAALDKVCDKYASFLSDFRKWARPVTFEGLAQPITDIELHSGNIAWDVPHGNLHDIWLATGLIVFILVIAIVNFINLITVGAETRLKEIAVRKISGASRPDMIRQFMGEAVIIALASLILAFIFLTGFSWSYVNGFTGKNIPESQLSDPLLIGGLVLLSVIIGIIAGTYPAVYLSRFTITRVLKGAVSKGMKINPFIRGLVLSQFVIVIFLISCMAVFYRQINYIKDKSLGFDKEYVVAVKGLNMSVYNNYGTLRQRLLQNDGIENVCLAQGIIAGNLSGQRAVAVGSDCEPELVRHTRTTPGFIKTFRLDILEGRDFDSTMSTDRKNYIINEAAVEALGFKGNAVGQPMALYDTGLVIGVVRDFNFASLHNKIEPLVITLNELNWGIIFVRLKSFYIRDGLEFISRTIQSADPLYSLEYEFVDDTFNAMYMQEQKMSKILSLTTGISILLAFMGLVAMTSFTILRRVKEIGIRKINGATITEVLVMLNRDYARWIAIAFVISAPVAWFVMKSWIEGFAFRTSLSWWIFALSGLSALVISLISVSMICWKAATRNPVEALRYE